MFEARLLERVLACDRRDHVVTASAERHLAGLSKNPIVLGEEDPRRLGHPAFSSSSLPTRSTISCSEKFDLIQYSTAPSVDAFRISKSFDELERITTGILLVF